MNADTDPQLAELFATPLVELRDDPQALSAVLARLETADRRDASDARRGWILAAAGAAGALLASGIFVASNAASASVESFSALSMRLATALAQADWPAASLMGRVPDGSFALGVGIIALAAAGGVVLRWRGT